MADWRARPGPNRSQMTKIMKESVKTGHPTGLPDKLLRLFAPGQPLPHIPANCAPKRPPALPWTGVGGYVSHFAAPGDPEHEPPSAATTEFGSQPRLFNNKELEVQVRLDAETRQEKDKRLQEWKHEQAKRDIDEKAAAYDPTNDPMIEGDPYKTLFVSRLSFDVTERKLRHEFEEFGPIARIRLVHDQDKDKPRGYAFIEYEHKADMKEAYKNSDGRKIEGRRILVDVERGRTVEGWRPMRLGGGLGGDSRAPKEPRKKQLAEAAARGVALPPPGADSRRPGNVRGGMPSSYGAGDRGPPRSSYDRGPPAADRYGGGGGGGRSGGYGGGGGGYGGSSRDYGGGGGGRDSGGGSSRDRGRDYGDRGGGYGGSDRGGGDRDRGGYGSRDYRDRSDRDKRSRDGSPGRDYKRSRYDDDRRGRDY